MLVLERRNQIMEMLNTTGSVRVAELAQSFQVTEETIRRDLEELEAQGVLQRTYGGAVKIRGTPSEPSFNVRKDERKEEKEKIAKHALAYVSPGLAVALDASTSALFLARRLGQVGPLTVLTNSLQAVFELSRYPNVDVLATGGRLRRPSYSLVGPLAEETFQKYQADVAFISAKGCSAERGLTESSDLEASLKSRLIHSCRRVIALIDSSKLGYAAFAHVCPLDKIDLIITDQGASPEELDRIREAGAAVEVAG